jgi:hypothetical protein
MTAQEPVLRDIHLPAEPGWWPPAPGWWVLAGLALLAALWLWRVHARRRRLQRQRRALHAELDAARAAPDAAAQVAAISLLLRRVAKRHAPHALALRDEAWLRFLDAGDATRPFSNGPGRLLLDGPYRPAIAPEDADALARVVRARLDAFVEPAHA